MDHLGVALAEGLPLWIVFAGTVAIAMISCEIGIRVGEAKRRLATKCAEELLGTLVAATLGLLAFMLTFTFAMAGARFDSRKLLIIDEANAIGTTWLRAALLPEPPRSDAQTLLRQYAELRVNIADAQTLALAIPKAEELQDRLWALAADLQEKRPDAVYITAFFCQSLNQMIDLHSKRITVALMYRIPPAIWFVLYLVLIMAMVELGYSMGLTGARRRVVTLLLIIAFSAAAFLIADLERPLEGFIGVSQQPMADLLKRMEPVTPK